MMHWGEHTPGRCLCLILLTLLLIAVPIPVEASTFVVNTVDDSNDGTCDANHCSLREAINAANANPGADTIAFDIPGNPPHRLKLCTPLPPLSDGATIIDGTSEPDYNGVPVFIIEPRFTLSDPVDFGNCSATDIGIVTTSDDNIIRGLSLVGFGSWMTPNPSAIYVLSGTNNRIEQNYIGLEPSGAVRGNTYGIIVTSENTHINDNVISTNTVGIKVNAGHTIIRGNFIGTDPAGAKSPPGYGNNTGIWIESGANHNTIGGELPGQRNVISGNDSYGVFVNSDYNHISKNHIGTNLLDDFAIPNSNGIVLRGDVNFVRENTIGGNDYAGIMVQGILNFIEANAIGTDPGGTVNLSNQVGIVVEEGSNYIGSDSIPDAGNIIANNRQNGIIIYSSRNVVSLNTVSDNHRGIRLYGPASDNRISDNEIFNNGDNGITIVGIPSSNNTISMNQIYSNDLLGIDLDADGVTHNDAGDADTGPNDLLNFPEVNSSLITSSVTGSACLGCTVEVFLSDRDPSGYGEGQTFIDSTVTDSNGNFNIPVNFNFLRCTRLTATATDQEGNTSEFSKIARLGICIDIDYRVIIFTALLVIAAGTHIGRRFEQSVSDSTVGSAIVGGGIGLAISVGLILLGFAIPGVSYILPQPETAPMEKLPYCDHFLDLAASSPEDGTVFQTYANPDLSWSPNENLPEGEIRWRVSLLGADHLELDRTTPENHMRFSAFELSARPGDSYLWGLGGEVAAVGSETFESFCEPVILGSFQLGSLPPIGAPPLPSDTPDSPTPTSTPTPTPTPPLCLFTALQNSNCRVSDYAESLQIDILMQGESAELIALNPEFTHGKFGLNNGQCWIWLGLLDGPENPYGTCGVPVVDPPPEPTETPIACSPDLDQEACEASGGTWSEGAPGAPPCICPE